MRIAHNPQTGEYLGLQNGQWTPLRIAENSQGDRLYLGEDGWTPLPSGGAETPDTKKPSAMNEATRGFGIGVRNVLEGMGDLPNTFLNQPINAVGRLFGYDLGLGNPGTGLADALNLPKAQTDTEKLISAAQRGAAGVVPTLAAGAAPAVAKAVPTVAKIMSVAPGSQVASAAAGTAASEAARQAGGGEGVQMAAGLVGGIAPGVISPLAVTAGRSLKSGVRALTALSEGGQKQIAAENLRKYSNDPDTLLARLTEARGEIVPGSSPTLGQTIDDAGIAVAEKGRANRGPEGAQFGDRYRAQREARQAELEDLAAGIDARQTSQRGDIAENVGKLKPYEDVDVPEADNGTALRTIFDERYKAAKDRTRQAYDAIDPANSTAFHLEPLRESFSEVLPSGLFAPRLPSEITDIMSDIDNAIFNGNAATYRELQNMRRQLTNLAMTAQNSGDANLNRIATGMKSRLDQYLESAGSMDIAPVQPRPGSQAYKAAQAEARATAGADPWYDDLKYMYEQGINRDWLETQFGADAVSQLNGLYPGLVRRNGRFVPDVSSADLKTMNVRNDGQALYEKLLDRLPYRQNARERQASALADVLDANAVQPRGFTPEQMQRFEAAKAARREQAGLFESGANTRMSRGNAPSGLQDGQIMRNYFRPGPSGSDAAKDFLRAFGDDVNAAEIMRDHVVTQFRAASMGRDGTFSASKMRSFLKNYGDALSNFPELRAQLNAIVEQQQKLEAAQAASRSLYKRTGTGAAKLTGRPVGNADTSALDPTEITRFKALQDDIARNKRMEELSAVRGSPTAQNLATQAIMDTILGRSLGRNQNGVIPAPSRGLFATPIDFLKNIAVATGNSLAGIANRGAGVIFGKADDNINRLIDRAFLDPEFAKELLTNYKSYVPETNLGSIIKDAARGTTVETLRGLLGQFSQ